MRRLIGSVVVALVLAAACSDPSPPEPEPEPFTPTTLAPDPAPDPEAEAPEEADEAISASLSASATPSQPGGLGVLRYDATGCETAHISGHGQVNGAGHVAVHPEQTTTYTLTCSVGDLWLAERATISVGSDTLPVLATGGDDLVSEAELLLHVAKQATEDISLVLAGVMASEPHGDAVALKWCGDDDHGYPTPGIEDAYWHDQRLLTVKVAMGVEYGGVTDACEGGPQGTLLFHIVFGPSKYVDGKVDVEGCHTLPGAGTQTNGEHSTVTNDSTDAIHQTIKRSVTESTSHETSLDENVDTTSTTTGEISGGVPFGGEAKFTESVEAHFGLAKGSIDSESKETSVEKEAEITIEPGQILTIIETLDNSVERCDADIESVVDWGGLKVDVYRHRCGSACVSKGMDQLDQHKVYADHDHTITFDFDSIDDVARLASGDNPRCDGCHFVLRDGQYAGDLSSNNAWHHLRWVGHYRTVEFDGTRNTTTKDSASLIVRDTTGLDSDCVANAINDGDAIGDIDDALADC